MTRARTTERPDEHGRALRSTVLYSGCVTPVEALERVVHCLDRALESGFRVKAFIGALDAVRAMPEDELAKRIAGHTLTNVKGIGDSSAKVIEEAAAGGIPTYLAKLEAETAIPLSDAARPYRAALRGDLPASVGS